MLGFIRGIVLNSVAKEITKLDVITIENEDFLREKENNMVQAILIMTVQQLANMEDNKTVEEKLRNLFEQAGKQVKINETGLWIASAPERDRKRIIKEQPEVLKDWDDEVGDRMVKLVFIGKDMDKKKIIDDMNGLVD